MTKHLTKPIRAFHFMVLAFLMTLFSSVMAQDFQRGFAAYSTGDYATALQEWTPLAEAGDAIAQGNLGVMYERGQGVPQDYKEAMKWFRLAADQGNTDAQTHLASSYRKGEGVPQDIKEAIKWYRLAAYEGNSYAQNNLGIMYEYGHGVLQDNTMAHMWYNIASANGDDESGEWRDEIAKKMTTAAIEKAQAMARECMSSGYTKCGY